MTFDEVRATGADILRESFTSIPTSGWTELTIEQVRGIHEDAKQRLQKLASGFNAEAHHEALMLKESSSVAIERARAGARVFTVQWDGVRAFAATKGATRQCFKNELTAIPGCEVVPLRVSERAEGKWAAIILDGDGDQLGDSAGNVEPEIFGLEEAKRLAIGRAMAHRAESNPMTEEQRQEKLNKYYEILKLIWMPC